ncbi:MAG: hypothetical protein RIS35_3515 [Pseudomonadota bacterium]
MFRRAKLEIRDFDLAKRVREDLRRPGFVPMENPSIVKTHPLPGLAAPEDLTGDRQFSISLSRGLQLLRAFGPGDTALGNRELCDRTGLPKATVSRLAYTLMMLGYLSRSADNRYTLGAGVLSLGYPMLAGMRIRQIARPWLERLARETGCTVNLGLRDRLNAVYVETCRADRGNAWRPDIGSLVPLLTSAIGCALLVGSGAGEQSAVLNRLRVQDPARFEVERVTWEREREAFATVGFCTSLGEWRPDVHAVAVPLRQQIQPATMAVNCTRSLQPGQGRRFVQEVAEALKETARRIELDCAGEQPARGA